MDTMTTLQNKVQDLEQEIQFYQDLVRELPISFHYEHPKLGKKAVKCKTIEISNIEPSNKPTVLTMDWKLEEEIQYVETFLQPILDMVPHHIMFINRNGLITLMNTQVAQDYQINRNDYIGKHARELLKIKDESIIVLETLKTGEPIVNKEVFDKNYGIMNTHVIRSAEGEIQRVIGIFHFLNVIKSAEKQALAGRIAAGIAHEIRNPLTTVRGFLQLLQPRMDEEISELFSSLLIPEIDRANTIIKDFLQIAKPSDSSLETIEISEFIKNYLGNFLHSEALLHNFDLEFVIDPLAEGKLFVGDKEKLFSVFLNLFQNSKQAMTKGKLSIQILASYANNCLQIYFKDNGPGIPKEIVTHVFDPFFTTKDEGTGLGLSISRKIIENHGGSLTISSIEDGTQFMIELPTVIKKS
ncbi:ATPase [Bacillus coahuilensis p1.1.43]|uniref:histidine kinase n=1 Tax=Bacillus coahuilensis p1.1.43 TaxID=1150625 RepID=A0A147K664_9BACI|nr:ATP-binding protein [Bacillus coahuilensis]KUP05320.1 ATPase [Bacillus coahuilensis p1.1.43]